MVGVAGARLVARQEAEAVDAGLNQRRMVEKCLVQSLKLALKRK